MNNIKSSNRLIILYIIKSASINLTENQILRILSDLSLMSYFDFKDALYELNNNHHICANNTLKGEIYSLTGTGVNIINELKHDIKKSVRIKIKNYLKLNNYRLKIESEYKAEYFKIGENEYKISLKIIENLSIIFEILITVITREQAEQIVTSWPKNAGEIYSDLLLKLQ